MYFLGVKKTQHFRILSLSYIKNNEVIKIVVDEV